MPEPQPSSADASIPVLSLTTGEYVFRAGELADALYIVGTGQIELLRSGETFRHLALLGPGDVFGEDTAFDGLPRECDARAAAEATVLKVKAALFIDIIRVRPDVATAVMRSAAKRLLQVRAACLSLAMVPAHQSRVPAGPPTLAQFIHVESGTHFPVPELPETVVGRADPHIGFEPDIELSPVDTHRSLSRRHALVKRVETGFELVEAPRVANGTFHNGDKVEAGVPVPLRDGDEVSFGLIRTVFRAS